MRARGKGKVEVELTSLGLHPSIQYQIASSEAYPIYHFVMLCYKTTFGSVILVVK